MKTTVKHVGSVREWEGPEESSIKHLEVIEHWVDGGEVEIQFSINASWLYVEKPVFFSDDECRIKRRKAKAGEVWVDKKLRPYVYNYDLGEFVNIWSNENLRSVVKTVSYSAPSVEAYYARKFWNKVYGNEGILNQTMADEAAYKMSDIVEEAAQLEKQQCKPGN